MICLAADAPKDSMLWVMYALAAVTVIYVVVRPYLRRNKRDPLEKLPNFSLAQQRAIEREMQNLLVEMSEMARQISAQLETRSTKLELLVQDADQKIAELKRLSTMAPAAPSTPQPASEPPAAPPPPVDSRYTRIYSLADQGRSPGEIAREVGMPQGEVELILALRVR